MSVPVIAIDGPSASGKGTVASRVATALGFHYLESGALYRLVALAGGASPEKTAAGMDVAFVNEKITLSGQYVTDDVRREDIGNRASEIARIPAVRTALLERQRGFRKPPGLVADGRDMGTVVFPDAPYKIYLTASAEIRARRRLIQLKEKGLDVNLPDLAKELEERDRRDSERAVAPLKPAEDALLLDSSDLSIEQVVERILACLRTA